MRLHPVILAGGRGERFWPLSRHTRPKQLLPLLSDRPMIADTLERLRGLAPPSDTFVLTARDLVPAVRAAVPEIPAAHVIGEPVGRNTGPAVALASWWLGDAGEDAVAAILPSDHRIGPPERFREDLLSAGRLALAQRAIVTFGIPPTRAETGYGYIEVGPEVAPGSPVHRVAAFREKPDRATAERYVGDGRHLWNAGLFVFPPSVMLEELRAHAPEIARLLPGGPVPRLADLDAAALDRYYEAAPSISIDYAVMERSRHALVARAGFDWDDVGSWAAIGGTPDGAAEGANWARGPALLEDCRDVIAFGEGGLIAALGVSDLVIVRTADVTLVCPRARAQEVRRLVAALSKERGLDGYR
jgi:mannose-1-phosphate guanylyltransferase